MYTRCLRAGAYISGKAWLAILQPICCRLNSLPIRILSLNLVLQWCFCLNTRSHTLSLHVAQHKKNWARGIALTILFNLTSAYSMGIGVCSIRVNGMKFILYRERKHYWRNTRKEIRLVQYIVTLRWRFEIVEPLFSLINLLIVDLENMMKNCQSRKKCYKDLPFKRRYTYFKFP